MEIQKEVEKEVIIKADGKTFSAIYKAEEILKAEGYTVGIMSRDEPIGFADAKKYERIATWYNLDSNDKKKLDGIITSTDFREGDVKITYYKK